MLMIFQGKKSFLEPSAAGVFGQRYPSDCDIQACWFCVSVKIQSEFAPSTTAIARHQSGVECSF